VAHVSLLLNHCQWPSQLQFSYHGSNYQYHKSALTLPKTFRLSLAKDFRTAIIYPMVIITSVLCVLCSYLYQTSSRLHFSYSGSHYQWSICLLYHYQRVPEWPMCSFLYLYQMVQKSGLSLPKASSGLQSFYNDYPYQDPVKSYLFQGY
jgi:hypothetical protein